MKSSDSAMEEVADHYGIPSIHFGIEVARLEKENKLIMKSSNTPMARISGDELNASATVPTDAQGRILFSKDGVHPYPETGHVLYTQALAEAAWTPAMPKNPIDFRERLHGFYRELDRRKIPYFNMFDTSKTPEPQH